MIVALLVVGEIVNVARPNAEAEANPHDVTICNDLFRLGAVDRSDPGAAAEIVRLVDEIVTESDEASPEIENAGDSFTALRERLAAAGQGNGRRYKIQTSRPAEDHIEIAVPALFDQGSFAAAQRLAGFRDVAKPRRFPYPLSHRVVCDLCGARFIGVSYGKQRKRRYMCGGRHWRHEERCANRTLQADHLEEPVWQTVTRLLSEPGWLEERIRATHRPARRGKGDDLSRLRADLEAKRQQDDRLTRSHDAGVITSERFERVMRELQAEEAKLARQIEDLEARAERTRGALMAVEKVAQLAFKGRRRLDRLSPEDRARVLALLQAEIRVPKDGPVSLRVSLPLEEQGWSQKWARQDLNL